MSESEWSVWSSNGPYSIGLCKGLCLRLRLAIDHIDLRMLARIDTLMALFVALFIEHEAADAVPSPAHAWQWVKGRLAYYYYLLSLGLT